MIETNAIPPAVVEHTFTSTLNAWHLIALGAGVAVTHIYHTVVNAGGLKKIWNDFYNGPGASKP